jgi:hypothetical protein
VTLTQAQALLSCELDSAEESNFGELRVMFGSGDGWPSVSIYVDELGGYSVGTCVPSPSNPDATAAAFERATAFVELARLRPRGLYRFQR